MMQLRRSAPTPNAGRFLPLWALAWMLFAAMPRPTTADMSAARAALESGNHFEALKEALNSAETSPVEAYTLRGSAYDQLDEPELALGEFQRALSHDPDNSELLGRIAGLMKKSGRIRHAIAYLEAAYGHEPNNSAIARELVDLLDGLGEMKREIDVAKRALGALSDEETKAWLELRLGHRLYEERKYDDAQPFLAKAASRDSASTTTLFYLARCYSRSKNLTGSLATVDRALTIDPGSDDLRLLRADTLYRQGDFPAAYEEYWRLKESGSPHWGELTQKVRLAAARHKNEIPDIIASQYGVVLPLSLGIAALSLVLLVLIIVYFRNKD